MKTIKSLFVIIVAIIAIGNSSCKKEDPPRTEWDHVLVNVSNSIESYNSWLAEMLFQEIHDTIWPLDENGKPIKIRNPKTGEWQFNGIEVVYNDFTNCHKMSKNYVDDKMHYLHKKLWELQNADPHKRGLTKHPYEDCEIVIEPVDGKSLQDELQVLNQLGDLSIKYPNKSPMEIIKAEVEKQIPKAQKATLIFLEREVRKNDTKSAEAFVETVYLLEEFL